MAKTSFHNLFSLSLPVLMLAAISYGCAGTHSHISRGELETGHRVASLQQELAGLSSGTEPEEARLLAQTAIAYSRALAERYRVVPPALFHNLLIQMGIRERGLCYHWTEDLMRHLQSLALKSYRLHWGVAFKGSDLREHNSVVITARDHSFADGLVLDPWRNSGNLHWVAVRKDSYPWQELPRDQW
jgi:hypothetical protein